ncbi:MAG: hypothetical protein ABSD31_05640 [Candidatus Binataceae bacterium]
MLQGLEIAGGIVAFLVNAYLIYRQNGIFEEQNKIMRAQLQLENRKRKRRGDLSEPEPIAEISIYKRYWPMAAMAALTIAMWAAVGFDLYNRQYLSSSPTGLFLEYSTIGGNPSNQTCSATINGSLLMSYQKDFHVALTCEIIDATIDRLEDRRMAISQPFSIQEGAISITTPFSKEMVKSINDHLDMVSTPRGGTVQYTLQYQAVLLPTAGCDVSNLQRLSDIPRCGGKLLPEGRALRGISSRLPS